MRNVAIRERRSLSDDSTKAAVSVKDAVADAFLSYSSYHFGSDD